MLRTVVLRLEYASESGFLGSTLKVSAPVGVGWGLGLCISSQFPEDAEAPGPGPRPENRHPGRLVGVWTSHSRGSRLSC